MNELLALGSFLLGLVCCWLAYIGPRRNPDFPLGVRVKLWLIAGFLTLFVPWLLISLVE
jgi:hypothetical protein